MSSGNPAMNMSVYQRAGYVESAAQSMTVQGAAIKTGLLVVILMAAATFTWTQSTTNPGLTQGLLVLGGIGGFITALVTIFAPRISPFTSPVYAALEGLFLGGLSVLFEARYPGIVMNAVGLTVGVLAIMLVIYSTGFIQVTDKVKTGIIAATGAIFLVYLVGFILSFFHVGIPYIHDSGPIGIIFSVVVVIIAAFNLLLDFDFIQQGALRQAPKFMEWYGGFSLLVTLVWMYLEILRLLAKVSNSRG